MTTIRTMQSGLIIEVVLILRTIIHVYPNLGLNLGFRTMKLVTSIYCRPQLKLSLTVTVTQSQDRLEESTHSLEGTSIEPVNHYKVLQATKILGKRCTYLRTMWQIFPKKEVKLLWEHRSQCDTWQVSAHS